MYAKFVELLNKNNISTYKVAKNTGISQSTLSDWKHNKSTPKIDKLKKLSSYFNVPITYFVGEEKEEKKGA